MPLPNYYQKGNGKKSMTVKAQVLSLPLLPFFFINYIY